VPQQKGESQSSKDTPATANSPYPRLLKELVHEQRQAAYYNQYKFLLSQLEVIPDKEHLYPPCNWEKEISEEDNLEGGNCTLRALFFTEDDILKSDVSSRVFASKKAFPHLNGTLSDPIFNITHFGHNKQHLRGCKTMSTYSPNELPETSIHQEPLPHKRLAAFVWQNFCVGMEYFTKNSNQLSTAHTLERDWCNARAITFDPTKQGMKHSYFKVGGKKVTQYFCITAKLSNYEADSYLGKMEFLTLYWYRTTNMNVRVIIVDSEYIAGSRDAAIVLHETNLVRVLYDIEEVIIARVKEEEKLSVNLKRTTIQDRTGPPPLSFFTLIIPYLTLTHISKPTPASFESDNSL
jgi:hypothetical protein